MRHRTDCRCPLCDAEMASIMRMDSQQYAGWLNLTQSRRPRASGKRSFRTSAGGLTNKERERRRKELEYRKSLIGTVLSVWGPTLTEDDLRRFPTNRLEDMATRGREQANEMKSARAAAPIDYMPAPKPYSIALAKRAAQGCSR